METTIYQHWVGQMVVKAGVIPAATHPVDAWFPAAPPAGATLLGQDVCPTPTTLFADVLRLQGKVGPFKFRINVNLAFTGTVEYLAGAPSGSARGRRWSLKEGVLSPSRVRERRAAMPIEAFLTAAGGRAPAGKTGWLSDHIGRIAVNQASRPGVDENPWACLKIAVDALRLAITIHALDTGLLGSTGGPGPAGWSP